MSAKSSWYRMARTFRSHPRSSLHSQFTWRRLSTAYITTLKTNQAVTPFQSPWMTMEEVRLPLAS